MKIYIIASARDDNNNTKLSPGLMSANSNTPRRIITNKHGTKTKRNTDLKLAADLSSANR